MNWLQRLFRRDKRGSRPAEPFPEQWLHVLETSVALYRRLPPEQRPALRENIQRFIAEKEFWGSAGLEVTDEMKVVIAASACLLVLGLPEFGLYPRTREVIIYPGEFGETVEAIGPDGRRHIIDDLSIGEAAYRGPILLAWDSVKRQARRPRSADNVILHEFAHALDFLDGLADGTPPIGGDERLAEWVRAFTAEYDRLVEADRRGRTTLLDPYGAEDPAEFFAVATECFFQQPARLKKRHYELYRQLQSFYRQDPASWEP
jgi:Mlc titration factor MtfA (ptsG expression regulator)